MEGVLQGPAAHGGKVHPHPAADLLPGLVKKGNALAGKRDHCLRWQSNADLPAITAPPARPFWIGEKPGLWARWAARQQSSRSLGFPTSGAQVT